MEVSRSASSHLAPQFPRYSAAVLGFGNYWYPAMFSRDLKDRPAGVTLLGEKIALFREGGRVYGLADRCPHRGVPLSAGRRECPGTVSCVYHGWTYDLASGQLVAVITDGPDSPICGRAHVAVRTYPAEERKGLVWVYVGDQPPPPVEADIPEELLRADTVLEGTVRLRTGNWRYALENGCDEGHARYQHRYALWNTFRESAAWTREVEMFVSDDGLWLERRRHGRVYSDVYPRIGRWPKKPARFWQSRSRGSSDQSLRLPCIMRGKQPTWTEYQIYVPVDADHYLGFLLAATWATGLEAAMFRLRYRTYIRRLKHEAFYAEDQWMVDLMNIPPERLYRPDVSITAWRRFAEENARGPRDTAPAPPQADDPIFSSAPEAD